MASMAPKSCDLLILNACILTMNDKRLVYQHTDTHSSADLYAIDAASGARPIRLSDSMPANLDHSAFVEPELVHYPGPDGQPVPAWLFVPKNLDRSKKNPAILWVHGDAPFRFQRWYGGKLPVGGDGDFKVFLGQPGLGRSSFCAAQEHFLPDGESVQATLIYRDGMGKEQRLVCELKERC